MHVVATILTTKVRPQTLPSTTPHPPVRHTHKPHFKDDQLKFHVLEFLSATFSFVLCLAGIAEEMRVFFALLFIGGTYAGKVKHASPNLHFTIICISCKNFVYLT